MEDTVPTLAPGRCPTCGMKRVKRAMKPGDKAKMAAAAKPAAATAKAAHTPAPGAAPKPGTPAGKAKYHCPMHPQIVQDKPGECPICFMQLVPIRQEDVRMPIEGRAVVNMDADRRRQLGVATETVRRRHLTRTIRLPGRIAYDPGLYEALTEYQSAAEAGARAGDRTAGPMAAVLNAARLKLARFGLDEAQARALAASGRVQTLILPGDTMWVLASAFDQDLAWIRRGQTARIEVSSLPGRKITGTVEAIEPSLDPVSRTATVRLLADNPVGAAMRLEMYATVRVEAEMGERLVVPRDAVLDTGERKIVFVVRGDGLEPREIETGIRADDGLEVTRGLKAGETVVLSGNFLIDAESRIRADIAKMMSAPEPVSGSVPADTDTPRPPAATETGGHAH